MNVSRGHKIGAFESESGTMVELTRRGLTETPSLAVPYLWPSPHRVASATTRSWGGGLFMGKKAADMSGQRFGRLVVLERSGVAHAGHALWLCRCDCGTEVRSYGSHLRQGRVNSCGCLAVEHGMSGSRVYCIWRGMRGRCENPRDKRWSDYGGRGITVCERWRSFSNFYADMGVPPDDFSIERIDNDRGYEPANCRWASRKEQQRNRRGNVVIELNGVALTLVEWSERLNIPYGRLQARAYRGWPSERILLPVNLRGW